MLTQLFFLNHRKPEKYQVLEGKEINKIPVNKIPVKHQMKYSEKLKYFEDDGTINSIF